MDSETVRIRLIFEEGHLLSKSQRINGLKRSWILLKSHLHSISDFSSYLLDFFLLRNACPDGLILSMDGFVLPPFEPTAVLKDKDIVRVKKKEDNVTAVDKVADMVEGQSADIDVQLQANEELVMDGSDYKNVADEDETYDLPHQLEDTLEAGSNKKTFCRKRKALKTPHSSKYLTPIAVIQKLKNCQQHIDLDHNQRFQQDVMLPEKSPVKKPKSSNVHTDAYDSNKKNLKKDKKQLMRKQDKAQKEKVQQRIVEKSKSKLPDENYFEESEKLAGSSDDEEIVPVVVRPGHVRFLPSGQANQFVHPAETSMDTSSLDRITIKKGQKWGKGKSSSWRSNCKNCEGQSSTLQVKKDFATWNYPIDFDKLKPCASLPKGGDIIAYRLIDLSSSWTPELSSFRVGKVSWCKPEANKIMLIPVPEYPFVFKKAVNEVSATQVDTSPYAKDGSLKADYSSLVDIRIVGRENSSSFEEAANKISEVSSTKQSWNKWENHSSAPKQSWNKWENRTSAPKRSWKKWENHTNAQENGKENAWDEILQAWSAKKTNVSKEVRWSRAEKKVQEGAHRSW
ncbi:coilin-like isoform X2 [Momordica charantia]|uniref:Coilin-like isoform X2 n=1 Tax=Momordica charantia TaxID=3673 RepID=A0A6J1BRI7_MOMCH|nr:coilin-like isoform X2 [Momordica charantia]